MSDNTKPVIVITGGTDNGAFFDAARRESDRHDVVVLTPSESIPNVGRLRDAHTTDMLRTRSEHNARQRVAGMSPAFAAPYGRSQQDLDRIAAAEAKRARKAAKRSKA